MRSLRTSPITRKNKVEMKRVSQELVRGGVTMPPQALTGIDTMVGLVSAPGVLIYPKGLDHEALKTSLQTVLAAYPVFSARLVTDRQRMMLIDASDQGVGFEVWRHAHDMPVYG